MSAVRAGHDRAMRTVDVAPINPDRLDPLVGPERWAQVQRGVPHRSSPYQTEAR